jgi:hypothetical protein
MYINLAYLVALREKLSYDIQYKELSRINDDTR